MDKTLRDWKSKQYGGAWPIYDKETMEHRSSFEYVKKNSNDFLKNYREWFVQGHNINGFERYNELAFSNGTTETFDKFYHKHTDKRLRIFKGEYFYHQMMGRIYKKFAWIDEDELKEGDVLVTSVPFSDTGNVHENLDELLQVCESKNIPVLIDLAYINISQPLKLNLNYNCIDTITTSLSKIFPIEHFRVGIRLQQKRLDDQMYACNEGEYINHYSVALGQHMIDMFPNNFIVKKYIEKQKVMCNTLGVEQSSCVIFGIDKNGKYDQYNRGGKTNRLCFSRIWDVRFCTCEVCTKAGYNTHLKDGESFIKNR